MTTPNLQIGPIKSGLMVETALKATVQKWAPTYLAEAAAQHGIERARLPLFRSYSSKLVIAKAAEDQMPACVIVAPGTVNSPRRNSGKVTATWSAGVGCIVSGQDEVSTYNLARVYVAALRTLLLQQADLGGFAAGTDLVSERYDDLDSKQLRSLCAGVVQLYVQVNNITDTQLGPLDPATDPTKPMPDPATADTIGFNIEPLVS